MLRYEEDCCDSGAETGKRPGRLPAVLQLEKGQIWKTGETYVKITDAGKRLVHYKISKVLQRRGLRKHLASIKTVQTFLKSNRAELLVNADGEAPSFR